MHTRRLVAFLLGVWLGGMLFVAYTSNANISTTKNLLDSGGSTTRQMIELAGRDRASLLLLHNTAQMNRFMITSWEYLQLLLGAAVVCTLPFAMRMKWGYVIPAALMLLIVLAQRVLLTPEMVGLGRTLDLAGGDAWTQDELWKERRSLYTLQMLYWSCEIAKALTGIGLTASLIIFRRRASQRPSGTRRRENGDSVDESNYSHVDG